MAQCFISTYRNHYRWQDPVDTPSAKIPYDKFTSVIPSEDIWIETPRDVDDLSLEELEKRLYKSCLKRYVTTYQQSYCKSQVEKLIESRVGKSQEPTNSAGFENQLLESSKNLYEPDSRPKVAPPIGGTRRVFGYIRPSRNYMPLTNYQYFFGKTAYKILKREGRKSSKIQQDISENQQVQQNEIIGEEKKEEIEPSCDCPCCLKNLKK